MDGPVGMVQRANGDVIVANSRGEFIARIPEDGGAAEVVLRDERLKQPNGVTIDLAGNIYIADLDSGTVFKWTPEGDLLEFVELPGDGNSHRGSMFGGRGW